MLALTQTVFTGALASLDIEAKGRAIAFILVAGMAATSCSPLIFGMVGLGLDDQKDM